MPPSPYSSNFYWAMRLLPKEKREAMFAFYQFCRVVDDAVDLAPSPSEAREPLNQWQQQLNLCYTATPSNPLAQQLQKIIYTYHIPREDLEVILRGVEMDLRQQRFQTFHELENYCYCVASAVGLVSARILGVSMSRGSDFAILLGKALQLTNILRDLKEDVRKGRFYLPQDELEQFDYPEEKLLRFVQDTAFMKLADFQCRRVRIFFNKADAAFSSLTFEDQKRSFPARIMEEIYKLILEQIEKKPYNIFNKRISVPKWKKVVVALGHWIEPHIK
jgi:phytoene synthase